MIRGFRRSQVLDVNRAVRIQHFGKSQLYVSARWSLRADARHAGKILPEIENVNAGLWFVHRFRLQLFMLSDRRKILPFYFRLNRMNDFD